MGTSQPRPEGVDPRIWTALLSVNPTGQRPAWHGCPKATGVLRGVTPGEAVWRPYAGANHIREIALHIAFWENSVASRLSGERVRLTFAQRKTGWAAPCDPLADGQWRDEVGLVWAARQRLVAAVAAVGPERLDEPIGTRSARPTIEYIHGVAEHSLYHTAQIKMLKALAEQAGVG